MFFRSARFLRIEGLLLLPLSLGIFAQTERPWWWAVAVLLLPDFVLTKRVHEHRVGQWVYDAFHTYFLPSVATVIAVVTDSGFQTRLAAISMLWFAHIALDRLLGRGACYAGRVVDDLYARAGELMKQTNAWQD